MSMKASEKQEQTVVQIRQISFDGIMPWEDVHLASGKLSRPTIWREEKEGRFPARVQLTGNRVGWNGNEIKAWIDSRPRVNSKNKEITTV